MTNQLLMVAHVPLRLRDGKLGVDKQTCRNLICWAKHFDRIVYACPQLPEELAECSQTSDTWQAIADLPCASQIRILPLPWAYHPIGFLRTYWKTRQLLRHWIQQCDYLWFSPSVLVGDWSAVACLEAMQLNRSYAVAIDRVEYEVIRRTLKRHSISTQIKEHILLPFVKPYVHFMIRQSQVGLFQGQDCYQVFAPSCRQPFCVYDVHTRRSDQISPDSLQDKVRSLQAGCPLKIVYAGRADEMKGGLDWVRTIAGLVESGVPLQATWLGDGPLLGSMQDLATELGVAAHINFMGFVGDFAQVLAVLKSHHVFMFCHKTPESPRCLVEALVSGCAIVGYDGAYGRGLVANYGGGSFSPLDDHRALAEQVLQFHHDRGQLSGLVQAAARSGQQFDEESVISHRCSLVKTHLQTAMVPSLGIA